MAAKIVREYEQAKAYCDASSQRFRLRPTNARFCFVDHIYNSEGVINVRPPLDNNGIISFDVGVVREDITPLIGLEDLKYKELLVKYVENRVELISEGLPSPIRYKNGYNFLE